MFGFEESYGYLVKPFVRDKDAIQALLLLAEVAAYYKQGKTLYDGLQTILKPMATTQKNDFCDNERTRRFCENLCFDGKFREEAPTEFAGAKSSKQKTSKS